MYSSFSLSKFFYGRNLQRDHAHRSRIQRALKLRRRIGLEPLEPRLLLSGDPLATVDAGVLSATFTANADNVVITQQGVADDGGVIVDLSVNGATERYGSVEQGVNALLLDGAEGDDTFQFIDLTAPITLMGGAGDDTLTGNANANVIIGGAGNDSLTGGAGDDTYRYLEGLQGDDTITEAANEGIDTLDFSPLTSAVTVDLSLSIQQVVAGSAATPRLRLTLNTAANFEGAVGGAGDDTLTGNAANNLLTGGVGTDTLVETRDANFTLTNTTLTIGSDIDAIAGFEKAVLTGGAGDNQLNAAAFTGSVTLDGAGGADTLTGSGGNDTLIGGADNDSLDGGGGDDVYLYDADTALGSDTILAGTGADTLDFSNTGLGITLNLATVGSSQVATPNLTLTLNSGHAVRNVIGGSGDDTLTGDAFDNRLSGGPGADHLAGGGGHDTYVFQAGWEHDVVAPDDDTGIEVTGAFTIENDPNTPGNVRAFMTATGDWISFAPANARLSGGDITLSNLNLYTNGGSLTLDSHSISITNSTISTRQIAAGGNVDTAVSMGNSGGITLNAPEITLDAGTRLLAHVINSGGTTFTAGDVTISARDTVGILFSILSITRTSAHVAMHGATLKGKDVKVEAIADGSRTFVEGDPLGDAILSFLTSVRPLAGVTIADSTATITVDNHSAITASSVLIDSLAQAEAKILTSSFTGPLAVAYGRANATARSVVTSADIHTTGGVTIRSRSVDKLDVSAKQGITPIPASADSKRNLTIAVSEAEVEATTTVGSDAEINAGGGVEVLAEMDKNVRTTSAAGAYGDGVLGIGVVYSGSTSTVSASVAGRITAVDDVEIKSDSETIRNTTGASSQVGDGIAQTVVRALRLDKAADSVYNALKRQTPPLDDAACGATQESANSGALAIALHTNNATATVAPDAEVTSSVGKVTVQATIQDLPQVAAIAMVDSDALPGQGANIKKDSKSLAVSVGIFHNNAEAFIGVGATVNAREGVVVLSETQAPFANVWLDVHGPTDVLAKLNSNFGIQDDFFTSWSQSGAAGTGSAFALSVNFLEIDNTSKAHIDSGALINQNATYQGSGEQQVVVNATNLTETLNLSGVFSAGQLVKGPFALAGIGAVPTPGGKGIGGSYLQVQSDAEVKAWIASDAHVHADSLAVIAENTNRHISIAESGGPSFTGGTLGFNGAFSLIRVDDHVHAWIDDGAQIAVGNQLYHDPSGDASLIVRATDNSAQIINAAGGVTLALTRVSASPLRSLISSATPKRHWVTSALRTTLRKPPRDLSRRLATCSCGRPTRRKL